MIKIYDINDNVLIQVELTSAAVREEELSKSDYIQLSFSTAEKLILPVGAYIKHTYKIDKVRKVTQKFLLLEAYEPTQTNESSWKYTPNFQHPKMILSKTPFYVLTKNSKNEQIKQSVWSFVGITSSLCEKIADFLNKNIKFGKCGWVCNMVGVTANTVNVSFSDNDFISALSAICNAIGDNCEWHIDYDNEQIYIGKVVIGSEPVLLEVGKNISSPSINSSKEGYYNSFSVFGGSRNITQTNGNGENISSGDIRLQLSAGTGSIIIDGKQQAFTIDEFSTIDLRKDKEKEPLFTKILDFSDIFPSLNTYAYNVRGRVKYVFDENNKKIPLSYNSDGSVKEYKTFTVWYMRLAYPTTEKISGKTLINTTIDDGVTHYWYDFEITDDLLINGKNIGCSFEANFNDGALSTPLTGRGTNGDYVGFELIYHDKDEQSKTSDDVNDNGFNIKKGYYEIIYQEDNDVIIPSNADSMLIPRGEEKPSLKCNITVLYNIAMKESVYEDDAKNRLLEAAKKEIIRLLSDLNNYSFKSYPQIFAIDNPWLQIGQNVTYNDGNGYTLKSRVLKLTTNIDYDFVQEITIGNQTIKGTTTQLREDVQKIIASGGSNGGGTYTAAQINNLVAKYGTNHFLSKKFDDIANGFITFVEGIAIGVNKAYNIFKDGVANLFSLHLDDDLVVDGDTHLGQNGTNTDFGNYHADSSGARISVSEDGTSTAEFDYINIRRAAQFREITIKELRHIGGELAITAAAMVCSKVEKLDNAYKCYFDTSDSENGQQKVFQQFMVGDQARCQQFDIAESADGTKRTRYYWRLVTEVGDDYIVLSDVDKDELSTSEPQAGDNIVQLGYRYDDQPNRQSALIFSATADDAPSSKHYQGIDDYSLDHLVKDEGFDAAKGTFHSNVYGNSYTGDKDGNGYFAYDAKTKEATFKGTAVFTSGVELPKGSTLPDGTAIEDVTTKEDLKNLNIRSGNLLRNTSFLGDYESNDVSEDMDISDDAKIFSPNLKYWVVTGAVSVTPKDGIGNDGMAEIFPGALRQELAQPLLDGEPYSLSFYASGTTMTIIIGSMSFTQELTAEEKRYEIHFTNDGKGNDFVAIESDNATISDIMLTYGTIAPAWSPAYVDNDKSVAQFQNIKYLFDAITEASTTIDGGLAMTQQIKVGNFRNKRMIKETGGMSGYYNDGNSPYLWGGGTLEQAIRTIQKYKDNPTYEPTEEDLKEMVGFVVTHGGRAILNDIILRGIIYAEGGVMKSIKSPNGNFSIDEQGNAKLKGEINSTKGSMGGFEIGADRIGSVQERDSDGNIINSSSETMSLFPNEIIFNSKYRQAILGCAWNYVKYMLRLDDEEKDVLTRYGAMIGVRGSTTDNVAIALNGGKITGLNFGNETFGFNDYYISNMDEYPSSVEYEIKRSTNCVFATTRCNWHWKKEDPSYYEVKDQQIVLKLPDMRWYDDGHEILIKRGPGSSNAVTIKTQRTCILRDSTEFGGQTTYTEEWYPSVILKGAGDYVTEYNLESEMDSICLRFFKNLAVTIDGTKHQGFWVEFKHPRAW